MSVAGFALIGGKVVSFVQALTATTVAAKTISESSHDIQQAVSKAKEAWERDRRLKPLVEKVGMLCQKLPLQNPRIQTTFNIPESLKKSGIKPKQILQAIENRGGQIKVRYPKTAHALAGSIEGVKQALIISYVAGFVQVGPTTLPLVQGAKYLVEKTGSGARLLSGTFSKDAASVAMEAYGLKADWQGPYIFTEITNLLTGIQSTFDILAKESSHG